MNIHEQGHITLSAFPVLSEAILSHAVPKSADFCWVFSVKFDINMSKRRRFMPQQVLGDIFPDIDKYSDYDPDQEDLNSQSNETSLQSNKEDEDEADNKTVKECEMVSPVFQDVLCW